MFKLIQWNAPEERGRRAGKPLAIVATGPSYDLVGRTELEGWTVLAVNAAITEFQHHPDAYWVCHDWWKIFRHDMRGRLANSAPWRVVTRRVYVPGKFGDVRSLNADKTLCERPFPHRILPVDQLRIGDLRWYSEVDGDPGYCHAEETSVEVALEVATWWGADPIVLIGVDMKREKDASYATPWRWKTCHINVFKFAKMRRAFEQFRDRWPARVFTVSRTFHGKFTPLASLADLNLQVVP